MTPVAEYSLAARKTPQGKLELTDKRAYALALKALPVGPLVVKLKAQRPQRTLDQNSYWWAIPVKLLAEHCGYTDTQMHYALLGECFGYTSGPLGQPVPVKPSSSDLTVEEFTHLIDWVLTWGPTELGLVIPAPHEAL